MERGDLQRLSKDELIDLVLRLQRPEKTSRTSSKPPATDRKERRDKAKPGGAKPGHEGKARAMSETFDRQVDHRPGQCPCCRAKLSDDLPAETAGEYETIELPEIHPVVERHRRLSVRCPSCGVLVAAKVPDAAKGTPFGSRIHAVATYLKTFQALSYERLQRAFADLYGLTISQGGLMNMLRRSQTAFVPERDTAIAALRRAKVVASDETGVRIEGSNAYQWVFRSNEAVVHRAAPTRGAVVLRELMEGHRPEVWCSDRYSAQQGHGAAHQTCLAHLARNVAYADQTSDDMLPSRLRLWLKRTFALADGIADDEASQAGGELLAALFFAIMFAGFLLQVVSRYIFNQPIGWTFELCVVAYIWIVFWSSAFLLKERDHVAFNVIYLASPPGVQRWFLMIGFGFLLAAFAASLPMTIDFVTFMAIDRTPLLRLRFDWVFAVYILFMLAVIYRCAHALLRVLGPRWRETVEKGGGSETLL